MFKKTHIARTVAFLFFKADKSKSIAKEYLHVNINTDGVTLDLDSLLESPSFCTVASSPEKVNK
tara:strand:- start:531 stop:722 length:192 start_codon:yes stop_codon:yes gene_type:complete